MYPPTAKDTQVEMIYPPHTPEHLRFAVGHEVFGLVPGLMMYATIWLREHNRVCDVLKQEHPEWDDERLFQTSRLILIGAQEQLFSITLFSRENETVSLQFPEMLGVCGACKITCFIVIQPLGLIRNITDLLF